MADVTVAGANGQTVTLTFDSNANALIAQQLTAAITAGVQGGTILAVSDTNGALPTLPPGTTGALFQSLDGLTFLPPGYKAVVDTAANAVIFGSGDSGESVILGAGDPTFIASGANGSGTVVAGGGVNRIIIPSSVAGSWSINTGNGDDTVLALGGGNDTVSAGLGHNAMQLSAGNDVVQTTGDDTINAGSGAETVGSIGNGSDLIFGNSSQLFFVGTIGSATVFGGTGSDTFFGGTGPDLVHGGTGGNNLLFAGTGAATLFGAGSGDELFAAGTQGQALHAGIGNETLFGGFSSGPDTFFGSAGNASITAGDGTNQFVFVDGQAGGTASIQAFMSGRDQIDLLGYGKNEVAQALKSQDNTNGSTTIRLTDHTTITFAGVANLTAADFVTTIGAASSTPGAIAAGTLGDDGESHGSSHSMGDMDDHGQIRDSMIKHS
jgi:hypothetical protein